MMLCAGFFVICIFASIFFVSRLNKPLGRPDVCTLMLWSCPEPEGCTAGAQACYPGPQRRPAPHPHKHLNDLIRSLPPRISAGCPPGGRGFAGWIQSFGGSKNTFRGSRILLLCRCKLHNACYHFRMITDEMQFVFG